MMLPYLGLVWELREPSAKLFNESEGQREAA
jgi:hypothetical protein